ncbi:hypothetical protein N7539_004990 [Penicillium diatomitis]|uniref:Noranthrone monooxygenase n=1 Tax=Penicillium diatomitis TaxID=2819901 RepID=A0A9W9X651_9EURO|nr:uncharacterized protein N7539_004990 [Penicillium diatomitis]KAJ5485002.1 hypothetical protein N7539_004990 [Penicillium diatomitis]
MDSSGSLGLGLAQAIGISGAAWLSGNIFALSINTVAALQESIHEDKVSPSIIAKQWSRMYAKGKTQNPPIAAAVAASFFYLAWSAPSDTFPANRATLSLSGLYSSAAVVTLGIVPFTLLAMVGTNNSLHRQAKSEVEVPEAETMELLGKWSYLNVIRGCFPLVGAVLGLMTLA